jgi:membrane-bound ClpP family serine protease
MNDVVLLFTLIGFILLFSMAFLIRSSYILHSFIALILFAYTCVFLYFVYEYYMLEQEFCTMQTSTLVLRNQMNSIMDSTSEDDSQEDDFTPRIRPYELSDKMREYVEKSWDDIDYLETGTGEEQ